MSCERPSGPVAEEPRESLLLSGDGRRTLDETLKADSAGERLLRYAASMRYILTRFAICVAACFLTGCGFRPGSLHAVSIPQFNTRSDDYVGTDLVIVGFLDESGGHLVLYLTEQHASAQDSGNAVYLAGVDPRAISCLGAWVRVVGEAGNLPGLLIPGITTVERISRIRPKEGEPRDCWRHMDAA